MTRPSAYRPYPENAPAEATSPKRPQVESGHRRPLWERLRRCVREGKSGAGEGARTLDPDLGKVRLLLAE